VSTPNVNRSLHKIIKTRGGFPNEEAALKLPLGAAPGCEEVEVPIPHWREALNHFTIIWLERVPVL
jgi:hypothetical protein